MIPIPNAQDGMTPAGRLILCHLRSLLAESHRWYVKTGKLLVSVFDKNPIAPLPELYEVMLHKVRDWVCRYPLIDNQGNIGSIDGDPPAGMRYNEMRFTPFGEAMFPEHGDLEPMASSFPQLLCNGAWAHSGKVVTEATEDAHASGPGNYGPIDFIPLNDWEGGELLSFIPPHNLGEMAQGLIHLVDNPKAALDDIMKLIPGPDFPTGGTIIQEEALRQLYETGQGSIRVRSKAKTEAGLRGRKVIAISEIPFAHNKTVIIEQLAERVHSKEYAWVSDIRDLSSQDGLRIEIEIRRGYDEQKLLETLLRCPPLEHRIDFRMVVTDAAGQRTASLLDLMQGFLEHRREMLGIDSSSKGRESLKSDLGQWLTRSDVRRTQFAQLT